MLRLIHLADLHLGWRPRFMEGEAAASLGKERDQVLEQAVAYALDAGNHINGVILAGDLFDDHRPPAALAERVITLLGRLTAAGRVVITVPGNHDELTYADSVYRSYAQRWPGVLITCPEPSHVASVEISGATLHVYGAAFLGGVTRARSPLAGWPRAQGRGISIALAHGTIVGGAGLPASWVADDRALPLAAEPLGTAGYDYVALGHIHRPGAPAGWATSWSACRYAGLVAGRGFDDRGCGSAVIVELKGQGLAATVTEIGFRVPAFCDVTLDLGAIAAAEPDLASPLDAIRRLIADLSEDPLLRVRLTGISREAVDAGAIAAALFGGDGLRHVEVIDQTLVFGPGELEALSTEPTVRGFFVRRLASRLTAAQEQGDADEQARIERALRLGIQALHGGPGQ